MRIVGGKYRNRRLKPPGEIEARPTTDFAKEGLFNVLHHSVPLEGIRVLDLFAGTGSIALEFLSRGAREVVSVDQDRKLAAFMERTASEWGERGWRVVRSEVFTFLRGHRSKYDIVFADPPFHMEGIGTIPTLVFQAGLLDQDGILIVEHSEHMDLHDQQGHQRTKRYGTIHFSLFTDPASTSQVTPEHE